MGAGPWTQIKGILYVRPDLVVSELTIWEPGAKSYMQQVPSCSYRSGSRLERWAGSGTHDFPVVVRSDGGELLAGAGVGGIGVGGAGAGAGALTGVDGGGASAALGVGVGVGVGSKESHTGANHDRQDTDAYDTLISVNVLEHVQDAFQYLTGLHLALRRGGLLILHERYYDDATLVDGDEYHPIRVKRAVLDKFLSLFHITFNNCSAAYDGRVGERGYYVTGIKL